MKRDLLLNRRKAVREQPYLVDIGSYELMKMTVKESHRGKGIGNQIMIFVIKFCKKKNARSICLYSNTKLNNAIKLYKNHNFKEISLTDASPYDLLNFKAQSIHLGRGLCGSRIWTFKNKPNFSRIGILCTSISSNQHSSRGLSRSHF